MTEDQIADNLIAAVKNLVDIQKAPTIDLIAKVASTTELSDELIELFDRIFPGWENEKPLESMMRVKRKENT